MANTLTWEWIELRERMEAIDNAFYKAVVRTIGLDGVYGHFQDGDHLWIAVSPSQFDPDLLPKLQEIINNPNLVETDKPLGTKLVIVCERDMEKPFTKYTIHAAKWYVDADGVHEGKPDIGTICIKRDIFVQG